MIQVLNIQLVFGCYQQRMDLKYLMAPIPAFLSCRHSNRPIFGRRMWEWNEMEWNRIELTWLLSPFDISWGCLKVSLMSGTSKCSRFILFISCLLPGTSHFFKKHWFLWTGKGFQDKSVHNVNGCSLFLGLVSGWMDRQTDGQNMLCVCAFYLILPIKFKSVGFR